MPLDDLAQRQGAKKDVDALGKKGPGASPEAGALEVRLQRECAEQTAR